MKGELDPELFDKSKGIPWEPKQNSSFSTLPQMWLLRQFPVSECLCFKSLCPRMESHWPRLVLASVSRAVCLRSEHGPTFPGKVCYLITKASYDPTPPHARCCSALSPVFMGVLLLSSLPVEIFSVQPVVSLLRDASPDPEWESQQSPVSPARHPSYIGHSLFCITHSAFCVCVFSSRPPTPSDLNCA